MKLKLLSLNLGRARELPGFPDKFSGIDKKPTERHVTVTTLGIEGDTIVDTRNHGGTQKAVCAYAAENYDYWREHLGVTRRLGAFGENLTLEGALEPAICAGDVFRIGPVRLQVTGPRKPCWKLAANWGVEDFVDISRKARRSGFYLRVLQTGQIVQGMDAELEDRPFPHLDLETFWNIIDGAPIEEEEIERLLAEEWLLHDWKPKLKERLG